MKKLNKISLKMLIAVFALVVSVCVCGTQASAATKTKNLKLIKGEGIQISFYGTMGKLKTVSSSNTKVVSAKRKSKSGTYYAVMKAKKKGTATVTCKFANLTMKYKVSVAKADFSMDSSVLPNGKVMVSFKNKVPFAFIKNATVAFTFKDSTGKVIEEKTANLYYVGPKKTAVCTTYVSNSSQVDWSKSSYRVTSIDRGDVLSYSFADCTSKVKFSGKKDGNYVYVTTNYSGLTDSGKTAYAGFSVYFYDSYGNLLNVYDSYNYLSSSSKTKTDSVYVPSGAASYKIKNKRAFEMKYTR